MNVSIREVTTKRDLRAFVHFPNELYKDNPYYVTQIESMDRDTLNPAKNHAFEVCEGKYWLAYDEKDEIVGRVAGILVARKYELRQAPLKKRSDVGPYLDGVFKCLNAAYSQLHGFSELSPGQCEDLKNSFSAMSTSILCR